MNDFNTLVNHILVRKQDYWQIDILKSNGPDERKILRRLGRTTVNDQHTPGS